MVTGYHNHSVEFAELDEEKPWDTFFQNTKSQVVMQLDLGMLWWVEQGNSNSAEYPGRATTIHMALLH